MTRYTRTGTVNQDSVETVKNFFLYTIEGGNYTGVSINLTNANAQHKPIKVTGGMGHEEIARVQKNVCPVIDESYSSISINLEVGLIGVDIDGT